MARTILLLAMLLFLAVPGIAAASECEGGRYLVEQDLPFSPVDPGRTVIVIAGDDDTVSMEPCGDAQRSKIRRTRRGMKVRAVWLGCEGLARHVRLNLRTTPGCDEAKGIVRSRGPRSAMLFRAQRGCEFAIDCMPYAVPVDTNGDQCDDACMPCPMILCLPGHQPIDTDGDTCLDSCEPVGLDCHDDTTCDDYLYCGKESGDCGGAGICRPYAEFCHENYDPVCGCDGTTYGNECDAASAGVNVASHGACETICGGIAGIGCDQREFCELPADTCQSADLQGVCVWRPEVCSYLSDPVCGCDGITYANDCVRLAEAAQKDHDGPCDPEE